MAIKNKKDIEITSIDYYIDGEKLPLSNGKLKLDAPTLGSKILEAKISFEEQSVNITKKIRLLAANAPEIYTYDIINTFPHDPGAYTQGLEFSNGTLV